MPSRSSRRCTATPRRKENDWAFHYLPKIDRKYSWTEIWDDMYHGHIKGLFAFGMNGVAIGPNSRKNIEALKKADWLVVCEIYPGRDQRVLEVARHHAGGDEERSRRPSIVCRARASPRRTARSSTPRAGCNGRTPRCRRRARRKLDQEILARIFLKVRELYQKEGGKFPDPDPEPVVELHRSAASVARRSRARRSTGARSPTSPIRRPGRRSRPASSCPASAGSATTAPRRAATGSIAGRGPRPARRSQRRGTDDPSGLGIYPELGMVVAGEPARPVQPRLVRCLRKALGSRAAAGLVERSRSSAGSATTSPTSRPDSPSERSHGPVHHESGRRRPPLRAARRRSPTDRSRSTTSRSRARSRIRCTRSSRPTLWSRSSHRRPTSTERSAEGFNIVCTTYRLTEHYHYWTKNNPMNVQLCPSRSSRSRRSWRMSWASAAANG